MLRQRIRLLEAECDVLRERTTAPEHPRRGCAYCHRPLPEGHGCACREIARANAAEAKLSALSVGGCLHGTACVCQQRVVQAMEAATAAEARAEALAADCERLHGSLAAALERALAAEARADALWSKYTQHRRDPDDNPCAIQWGPLCTCGLDNLRGGR